MAELATNIPAMEDQPMDPRQFVEMVTQSENIAAEMPEDELARIAQDVIHDYDLDKGSMDEWFTGMERGLELAQMTKEAKSYPFKGAANIKYPLITSAALQFNARALPAIIPGDLVVKSRSFGEDPDGKKAARGERVSAHMSWQLTSKIEEWEEDTDALLMVLPIVGTMVRKVWYDATDGRPRSKLLEPGRFIVNSKVKSLSDAPRASEELDLYPAEIETRVRTGVFIDLELPEVDEDKDAAHLFIEQHRRIDLDEDGYSEPYIVTLHHETQKVVRIVADFDPDDVRYEMGEETVLVDVMGADPFGNAGVVGQMPQTVQVPVGINKINRNSYFVPYRFLPGMDGGWLGMGLGFLLGDISETIDSILNMLLDAGHYASLGGGWIGSEARLKGGPQRFSPGEWKMIPSRGGDIRQAIVPMTFPGPDATLFSMLGMLIEAGREIASVKDIMTGDSGTKNMTATTTLALIEQGQMVFSAAYKRIFRALKREYKLLAALNSRYVTPEEYNQFHDGQEQFDPSQEYAAADMDIEPIADPHSITKMQQAAKAQLLMEMAQAGLVDPGAAASRVIEAADIGDADELVPQPDPAVQQQQQAMEAMQMQMIQIDLAQKMADIEETMAKVDKLKADAMASAKGAEIEEKRLRFDGLKAILENQRKELEASFRGRPENVAG